MKNIADTESLTVNDLTCTFGEYRQLPTTEERMVLRNRVVDSLSAAYRCRDNSPIRSTYQFPYQFDDAFNRWESAVETPMDEFKRLLAGHDWTYSMSDDYSVWSRGNANRQRLQNLARTLGPEAQAAYEAAANQAQV
jgi:hypothetical protein